MNIFILLSLISSIALLFLGNWVYYLGKKKRLNIIFLLACLTLSYWAFCEFMMRQADTADTAYFWLKVGAFWPFAVSFLNHFALEFSGNKKFLASKLLYILIYAPSAAFSIIDFSTNWIRAGVTQEFWGYRYDFMTASWFNLLLIAWIISVGCFGLLIFIKCAFKSTDEKKRQQAKYASIGFLTLTIVGIITETLFPLLQIEFPPLTVDCFSIIGILIGYAIWKYEMFILSPATAAENIILTMPDSMILTDPHGKILIVNQSLTSLLGYKEHELIGQSTDILFEEEQFGSKIQKRLLNNDILKDVETTWKTKTGEKRLVSFSASLVKSERKNIGIVGVACDITERKRAEMMLKSSEEKFRTLAEESPSMISISQNGIIVYANKKAQEAAGITRKKLYSPDLNVLDLIAPESIKSFKTTFTKKDGEDIDSVEYKMISKDGQVTDIIQRTKRIEYNGEPAVLGVATDITEINRLREKLEAYSKHLEDLVKERTVQLEQAQAQLVKSERLAAIGELASMIGHDLRNPLQAIKNAVYYLKKKGATCSEEKSEEVFETIIKSINYSNKIINDLLDYSREIHLELTECNPSTLLKEALLMVQVPDKVRINHCSDETLMMVDAEKIIRVFNNIIKNAIDAMPEGGTLEIRSQQMGNNVEIEFSDTGIGIPEEVLPKLFFPLFTTKAKGMGLGLSICKRIVESHGGSITVKSAVKEGTRFTVTLPIKPKISEEKTWVNLPESLLTGRKT